MFRQQRLQQSVVAGGDKAVPAVQSPLRQSRQCVVFAHQLFLQAGQVTMTDDKDKREGQSGTAAKNATKVSTDPRQDRLKQALRENLKRRKSQARGRGEVTVAPSNGDGVAPHDERGEKAGE
jgi:hypothetical protein